MNGLRATLALFLTMMAIAACSDTWSGVKEDTRENTQAVGQGVQDLGKKIEKQAQ